MTPMINMTFTYLQKKIIIDIVFSEGVQLDKTAYQVHFIICRHCYCLVCLFSKSICCC